MAPGTVKRAIWNKSDLKYHLSSAENDLHVPPPGPLPGRELAVLYIITGDDAFGLKTFLMKPYPLSGLSNEERIYNYRLSRDVYQEMHLVS